MSSRTAMIQWYLDREGKVEFSEDSPLGPDSYNSAGALFSALVEGEFLSGRTDGASVDFLLNLDGVMVQQIPRLDIQAGDVFVHGFRWNGQIKDNATCGVVLSPSKLLVCSAKTQGIGQTSTLWMLPTSVRWYRLMEPSTRNWRPHKLKTGQGLYVNGLNFDIYSDNCL